MAFVISQHALSDPLQPARFGLRLAPGTRVLRREDWLLWRAAAQAVQVAHEEATQITAGAQAAFDAEKARGYSDGREEAQLQQAEQMIEQVGRAVDYFARVEQRMVELVMQAVQRVITDFSDRDRVVAVVKGGLAVVRNQKQVTLRVAPAQVATVQQAQNELLAPLLATNVHTEKTVQGIPAVRRKLPSE